MTTPSTPESTPESDGSDQGSDHEHKLEEYAGGTIQARHGYLPVWLLVVYAVLFLWSLFYMVVYWGGLGPGRI
ncbi:hypothetical protein LJR231_005305 [Phyllobacterium sp. LjRoot231]|jgi:hypothetical protein|uniref:hypothetical protein n=1 Tax=Phyllobacterium sp. LjRoot231 TaxID=3342289 RepID=UPI003ED04787